MADVPIRIKVEFVDREARVGIERLKKQTRTALTPMEKSAIKVRASLKKLGIEGDKAGKKIKKSMTGGAFAIRGIATEMKAALQTLVFGMTAFTAAAGLLGRQAINMSAEFEVLQITFESLTGSVTQADTLIRDMKDFAVKTPLQLKDIEEAGTTLLAFGERAADVIPILNLLGEAATAMNKPLEQFIRVRNLLSQGVVLSRMLAPLGISRATLEEFGAGADATGQELVAAFDKALGRFEGLFKRTFDTIRGRISNLKDELDIMFAAIGDPIRDILISTVDQITGLLSEVRTFFEQNEFLIEESFLAIKAAAEGYLKPVIDILSNFLKKIKETPEYIRVVTDTFIKLATATTNLLIIGTLTTAFISLVATIVLLKLSLPVVMATFGIAPGVISRVTASVVGLNISIAGTKAALIGLQAAVPFLAVLTVAIVAIAQAWQLAADALTRYQQRLMGVYAGTAVVGEGEMGAISALRGIAREEETVPLTDEQRLFIISGGRRGSPGAFGTRPPEEPAPPSPFVPGIGGGAGRALSGKRRTEIETIGWLRELARNMPPLARAMGDIKRNIIDEAKALRELTAALEEAKIAENLRRKTELEFTRFIERRGFPSQLQFDTTASEGLMFRVIDPLRDLTEDIKETSNEFIDNLSRTLGNFLANWGRTGGKPDIAGAAQQILGPAAAQWGVDLAAKWNTGGFMAGPIAGAIMGGIGFIANRLMGEKPLEIKQPVTVHIASIDTRLKNFFNFRGLDPFTQRSSFRAAFENGVY